LLQTRSFLQQDDVVLPVYWLMRSGSILMHGESDNTHGVKKVKEEGEAVTKSRTNATLPLELIRRSQPKRQRSADMHTEEYLDHLSDQHVSGENQFSAIDDEIAALLAVAKMLVQLQEIDIPPEFVHRMELSIRACAHPHKLPQR
jgi:hypothetical protein